MSTNKFSIPGQWNFPKFEIVSGPQETVLQSGLTSTLVTLSGSGDTGGSESPEPS